MIPDICINTWNLGCTCQENSFLEKSCIPDIQVMWINDPGPKIHLDTHFSILFQAPRTTFGSFIVMEQESTILKTGEEEREKQKIETDILKVNTKSK